MRKEAESVWNKNYKSIVWCVKICSAGQNKKLSKLKERNEIKIYGSVIEKEKKKITNKTINLFASILTAAIKWNSILNKN